MFIVRPACLIRLSADSCRSPIRWPSSASHQRLSTACTMAIFLTDPPIESTNLPAVSTVARSLTWLTSLPNEFRLATNGLGVRAGGWRSGGVHRQHFGLVHPTCDVVLLPIGNDDGNAFESVVLRHARIRWLEHPFRSHHRLHAGIFPHPSTTN